MLDSVLLVPNNKNWDQNSLEADSLRTFSIDEIRNKHPDFCFSCLSRKVSAIRVINRRDIRAWHIYLYFLMICVVDKNTGGWGLALCWCEFSTHFSG